MFLVFDTETTTFPSKKVSHDHPSQAHIIQLAFVVLDHNLKEVLSYNSLIKPRGDFVISQGAYDAHGISNEMCKKFGVDIKVAMDCFMSAAILCKHQVAHNLQFDEQLVVIEALNTNQVAIEQSLNSICTMQYMTAICKIPQTTRAGFKWPKLAEAYKYVTGQELQKAHDALADVRGCVTLLKYLVEHRHLMLD